MSDQVTSKGFTCLGFVTFVNAINVMTGEMEEFTVKHRGETIDAIVNRSGFSVPASSEQFTEVAEAFHIDRYWKMLEESDVQGHARRCYA